MPTALTNAPSADNSPENEGHFQREQPADYMNRSSVQGGKKPTHINSDSSSDATRHGGRYVRDALDDPVGFGERRGRARLRDSNAAHTRCVGRADARRGVLDHQALGRRDPEEAGSLQVGGRMRLAGVYVVPVGVTFADAVTSVPSSNLR